MDILILTEFHINQFFQPRPITSQCILATWRMLAQMQMSTSAYLAKTETLELNCWTRLERMTSNETGSLLLLSTTRIFFSDGTICSIFFEPQFAKTGRFFNFLKVHFRFSQEEYKIKCQDLGKIESLKIWHDGSGLASAWFLDKVRSHFLLRKFDCITMQFIRYIAFDRL